MIIELDRYQEECFACPTIFNFQDTNENKYYFRLRHNQWRAVKEDITVPEVLATGTTEIGICDWKQAIELMASEGIYITEPKED